MPHLTKKKENRNYSGQNDGTGIRSVNWLEFVIPYVSDIEIDKH